jgi:short-subunit dehydrogenase
VARDEDALSRLAGDIGGSYVVADLVEPDAAVSVATHVVASYGRLDAVIANAGVGYAGDFVDMPSDRIVGLVDLNLRAPLLLARACLGPLRDTGELAGARRGALVFVGSIAGHVGVPGESVYSATKAGLAAFAATLREELRGDRISVSTIVPGVVRTEFFERRGAPYDRRFPRPMAPERVAAVVERALDTGADQLTVPRWLVVPATLAATAPRLYRALARRFG